MNFCFFTDLNQEKKNQIQRAQGKFYFVNCALEREKKIKRKARFYHFMFSFYLIVKFGP
jgi:hypothetical protein